MSNDNAGVPGAQKQGTHTASKEEGKKTWKVTAPNGSTVASGLTAAQASAKVKQLNGS